MGAGEGASEPRGVESEGGRAILQYPKGWTSRPWEELLLLKRGEAKAEKVGEKVREAARVTRLQRNFVWAEGLKEEKNFSSLRVAGLKKTLCKERKEEKNPNCDRQPLFIYCFLVTIITLFPLNMILP